MGGNHPSNLLEIDGGSGLLHGQGDFVSNNLYLCVVKAACYISVTGRSSVGCVRIINVIRHEVLCMLWSM